MEKPKNRRKTWRYFSNLDVIEFQGKWFVRFPKEREHHYFGKRNFGALLTAIHAEGLRLQQTHFSSEFQTPILTSRGEPSAEFIVDTARQLLANA